MKNDMIYEKADFPGIIGLIDGTHIPIQKTNVQHAELYRNRKSYFSINVQVMMGPDFRIHDIVRRWYGSAHDSHIFENPALYTCTYMYLKLQNVMSSWILGDSGYLHVCKPFLLTPFLHPATPHEERFNKSLKKTRNLIESGFRV